MAFVKKTWKRRLTEYPNRRKLLKTDGTTEIVDVERLEGTISQEGDAFSDDNMNDLEQRIADEFESVNSNLNGFSFTTQEDVDGYMKGGEFHPFGNPYLRYDADTGYIQALNENGQWINIYHSNALPILAELLNKEYTNLAFNSVYWFDTFTSKYTGTVKLTYSFSSTSNFGLGTFAVCKNPTSNYEYSNNVHYKSVGDSAASMSGEATFDIAVGDILKFWGQSSSNNYKVNGWIKIEPV